MGRIARKEWLVYGDLLQSTDTIAALAFHQTLTRDEERIGRGLIDYSHKVGTGYATT